MFETALYLPAYILIPQLRMLMDEFFHHLHAFLEIEVEHFNTVFPHEMFGALERFPFPNDYFRNVELHDGAGTKITRHKCRIQYRIPVTSYSTRLDEAIDFGMFH